MVEVSSFRILMVCTANICRSPHRIIAAADELQDGLAVTGLHQDHRRPSFAGHLMRFHAPKTTGG